MRESNVEKIAFWVILTVFLLGVGGFVIYLLWQGSEQKIKEDLKLIHDEAAAMVSLPSVIEEAPGTKTEIVYQPSQESKITSPVTKAVTPVPTEEPEPSVTPEPTETVSPTEAPASQSGGGGGLNVLTGAKNYTLEELYKFNPDLAGWLRIPGTEVDYPFAGVGSGSSKYGEIAFDGKTKTAFGTLFTHNNLSDPASIPNLVIYGHNMQGTGYGMFTQLLKYKDKNFAKNHARLELIVGDTPLVYTFFCAYNITTTDEFQYEQMAFTGPKDLTRYSEEILKRSKVKADGATAGPAHYITLSTCDRGYSGKNGRFVVVFVR